jgi:ABC-type sugar transport system substrate-binding protein
MKKPSVLVSLTTKDNDYQQEQAADAEQTARRLGVDLQTIFADNDAITQSQQLLKVIQNTTGPRPDAIVFEPAGGTALPQVARAAVSAGIGWVVVNRDVEYISDLRRGVRLPIFSVTSDHEEVGRIQGQQFSSLLPNGGSVLYIQGPAESLAAKQRSAGMYETKPVNIQLKVMKAQWTEESSYKTVSSWLRLSTSHESHIDVIGAQDDSMAAGARKAFQDHTTGAARDRWLSLPYTGCDGLPKTGQAWVRSGLLAATVVIPPNTGQAIDMIVQALKTEVMPPERSITAVSSFPALETLASTQKEKNRLLKV